MPHETEPPAPHEAAARTGARSSAAEDAKPERTTDIETRLGVDVLSTTGGPSAASSPATAPGAETADARAEARARARRREEELDADPAIVAARAAGEAARARRRRRSLIALAVLVAALVVSALVIAPLVGAADERAENGNLSHEVGTVTDARQKPDADLSEHRIWNGSITLNTQRFNLTLDGVHAPQAVAVLRQLTEERFYSGLRCHRLTTSPEFRMVQCGDPKGNGTGDAGYRWGPYENVPADHRYPAGTIAMANFGQPNTNGSQFFILVADAQMSADYTVVGHLDSVDALATMLASNAVVDGKTDGQPVHPIVIDGFDLR